MENKPFLEDIFPQNLNYAVTIRSPIAKGRLRMIKVPKLPDKYQIITARSIPGENRLEETNMPILAENKLSYIGEPVAILLGHDKTNLEDLAAQCEIIADEEKPVFALNEADYKSICAKREITIGEPIETFQKKGRIVTGSYSTGIQDHWYAEPSGAIAFFREQGAVTGEQRKKKKGQGTRDKGQGSVVSNQSDLSTSSANEQQPCSLTIKTATQWPYHVKRSVARVLAIDPSSVTVDTTALSLHMDGKLWLPSLIACQAALAAFITKKPVRFILNREEDFLYSPKRCETHIDLASVIDDNGNVTASMVDISVNLGAYEVNGHEIIDQVCLGTIGLYPVESLKLTAKACTTNLPPQGPFSGFGLSQGLFAMERHVSQIADILRIEPALLRINRIQKQNGVSNLVNCAPLLEGAAKLSDYYRKWASYELLRQSRKDEPAENGENPRGIGIAMGFQGNGLLYTGSDMGEYTVEVTLNKDNVLEIKTSLSSSEDYIKIWEKVAKETLSIESGKLIIISDESPDCGPSSASRNITVITKLVEKCCLAIRKQKHGTLPITVRRSIKPQKGALLNGLFHAQESKSMNISCFANPGRASAVVEVVIDLIECIPKVRGVWLNVDAGKIISKNRAKRSLMRGALQALGWSFTEYIEYENGKLPRYQYDNFSIPSPADIPPIHIDFYSEDKKDSNQRFAKGIGELAFTCIPAAFLQAVTQAMDYSFKSIPLKRKEIWEMIQIRHSPAGEK